MPRSPISSSSTQRVGTPISRSSTTSSNVFTAVGIESQLVPNAESTKANLLATIPAADGTTTGGIVLSGHTDVVPVDGQDWSSEPFAPEIRDGKLYARGSADMILFMPTFATSNMGISPTAAYLGGILAGLICLIGSPLVGRIADRVGPARIMTYAAIAALVLAWPLFQLIVTQRSVLAFIFVIAVLGVIMAFYFAPLPGMLSVLFPAEIRGTGQSTAYNIGVTLLGGIAPLVLTWLLDITGSLNSPSVYYIGVAVLSLIGLFFVRRHNGQR